MLVYLFFIIFYPLKTHTDMTITHVPMLVVMIVATLIGAEAVSLQPLDPRMVAIGDVHGDVDNFLSVLRQAQLIDCDGNWVGGTAVAIQMGDVCDRGPHSHSILEYIHDSLVPQAAAAGGEFVQLMGNHELLSMRGDHRFAIPSLLSTAFGGIPQWEAEFSPPRSYADALTFTPTPNGSGMPFIHPALKRAKRMIMRTPRKGTYGHVISQLPVMVVRYGTIFVHAGLLPVHAQLGVKEINRRMYYDVILPHVWEGPSRRPFDRMHTLGSATEAEKAFFALLKGGDGAVPTEGTVEMGRMVNVPMQAPDAFFEINSPVWTREQVYGAMRQQKCGLVKEALSTLSRTESLLWESRGVLAPEGSFPDVNPRADGWSSVPVGSKRRSRPLPINRLVVGHTIQPNGAISVFCGGHFLATDISMSQYMQGGGHLGYVEFRREAGVTISEESLGEGYEQEYKEVQIVEKLLVAEAKDHLLHLVGMPTYPAVPWAAHPPHTLPYPPLWSVAGHKKALSRLHTENAAQIKALSKDIADPALDTSNTEHMPTDGSHLSSLGDHMVVAGVFLGVGVFGVLIGGFFLLRRAGGRGGGGARYQRPATARVPIPY